VSEAAHPSSGSRAATSSTSSELELIEQLKQQLAGPLFAAVNDQFSNFQNTVLSYQNKLQYAELKIQVLEERLRMVRIAKYGPGSDKLSDAQLELLELEPGVSRVEVQAESERPAVPPAAKTTRQCATIRLRFFPDSLIARSSASQTLLPLPGSPSIHRPTRRGCSVKVVLRQQPQQLPVC
jgi:hypothetical protein